jgi:hypothetical protein
MSTFRYPQSSESTNDPTHAPADALDVTIDRELDSVVDAAQAAMIESVCGIIPVATVRVSDDPAIGPRAWTAEYVIAGFDDPDVAARPPLHRFWITRADRDGPSINAAELDILAIELDSLAADPEVAWTSKVDDSPIGTRAVISSAIGVSGTSRDRLMVGIVTDLRLRDVMHGPVERVLGLIYRLLDLSSASFEM